MTGYSEAGNFLDGSEPRSCDSEGMHLISDEEWPGYFAQPMERLSDDAEPMFDFWTYVEKIPVEDYKGFDCSAGQVADVYRHPGGRYEHVLINSDNRNVFMVIVLDRHAGLVVGHHLLRLDELYGLTGSVTNTVPGE